MWLKSIITDRKARKAMSWSNHPTMVIAYMDKERPTWRKSLIDNATYSQ